MKTINAALIRLTAIFFTAGLVMLPLARAEFLAPEEGGAPVVEFEEFDLYSDDTGFYEEEGPGEGILYEADDGSGGDEGVYEEPAEPEGDMTTDTGDTDAGDGEEYPGDSDGGTDEPGGEGDGSGDTYNGAEDTGNTGDQSGTQDDANYDGAEDPSYPREDEAEGCNADGTRCVYYNNYNKDVTITEITTEPAQGYDDPPSPDFKVTKETYQTYEWLDDGSGNYGWRLTSEYVYESWYRSWGDPAHDYRYPVANMNKGHESISYYGDEENEHSFRWYQTDAKGRVLRDDEWTMQNGDLETMNGHEDTFCYDGGCPFMAGIVPAAPDNITYSHEGHTYYGDGTSSLMHAVNLESLTEDSLPIFENMGQVHYFNKDNENTSYETYSSRKVYSDAQKTELVEHVVSQDTWNHISGGNMHTYEMVRYEDGDGNPMVSISRSALKTGATPGVLVIDDAVHASAAFQVDGGEPGAWNITALVVSEGSPAQTVFDWEAGDDLLAAGLDMGALNYWITWITEGEELAETSYAI